MLSCKWIFTIAYCPNPKGRHTMASDKKVKVSASTQVDAMMFVKSNFDGYAFHIVDSHLTDEMHYNVKPELVD